MKRNKFLYGVAALLLMGGLLFTGCSDDDEKIPTPPEQNKPDKPDKEEENKRVTTDEQYYANDFARYVMATYYYWNEQTAMDILKLDPNTNTDPIKTVHDIRYHEGDTQVDKWTMLIDDMKEFEGGVSGVTTTYGYQPFVYRIQGSKNLVAAVAFVYKDSPAQKAGLKRGDLIEKINGRYLTEGNYMELFNSSSIKLSLATTKQDEEGHNIITPTGKEVELTAVNMYEDPVLLDSIYECNGKKVGYLAYASFDLNSIPKLINVSKKFKAAGVKELILDFRYNGGGYVITENAMASMYAPEEAVRMREIFEIEKYNKILTKEFAKEGQDGITRFSTTHGVPNDDGGNTIYDTKDANIGIDKVYGLISRNSASASEALLSGLMPYVDVELIGERSHGKYCTGWMLPTQNVYKQVPEAIANWGIYVMVAVYQNAKKETPCMPDGLTPDVQANEDMLFRTQLGDTNEELLKEALKRAGKVYDEKETKSRTGQEFNLHEMDIPHKANFGKRILLPSQLPAMLKEQH